MHNRKLLTLIIVTIFIGMISCSGKKESHHEEEISGVDEWADMDSFHMIMAESFHPFMDSGNIEPAKANAVAMEELAARWANSSLPDKVNNDEVKNKLKALKSSTANFRALILQNDNKVLGDSLTKIHDLFHSIQEAWYGGGEHHQH